MKPPLSVAVHDEPELVVAGVAGMLGGRVRVVDLGAPDDAGRPDVVLCDPVGRKVDIEDYLAHVRTLTLAPLVAYSWSTQPATVRRTLVAGVRAFVAKTATADELLDVLHAVRRGEVVGPNPSGTGTDVVLSAREAQVLTLICRGRSNLEIAAELFVSVNSVKTYIRGVYQKIGVTRRSQAVAWGIARGY